MKYFEFSEDQLSNVHVLGSQLFSDEKDPRSITYVRILKRPKINWVRIASLTALVFLLLLSLGIGLYLLSNNILLSILCPVIGTLLLLFIFSKSLGLCLIHIYQRYAPATIRNRCRFEPSCSEYAELALQKYGFIKGSKKALNRLKRCNINNGGIDYP